MHRTPDSRLPGPAGSRLAQLLGELDQRLAGLRHGDFGERLGRLFDLSDAIALDGATGYRARGPFSPDADLPQLLEADLLATRRSLLDQLARSFRGEKAASVVALPLADADSPADKRPPFSPYPPFYQAHQRQIIAATASLRLRCRRQLAAHNPTLAHLAELDTVLESGLADYTRQGFAALPGFLERRYRALWQQRDPFHGPADWTGPRGWLQQFHAELKLLLLAELDARQEPVLGLLAAAREQIAGSADANSGGSPENSAAPQEINEVHPSP